MKIDNFQLNQLKSKILKKILFIITGIFLFFPPLFLNAGEYLWPIEGCRTLTGTFGEFRYSHFHAGIDISTKGITKLPVRAIDNGYVYRIKTSPGGYGRAIYLLLEDGNMAVYGHLSRFIAEIEKWVREKQLELRDFSVNIYPEPNAFPVKKGEVVGYSGDTGNVPPHLHFELRKKENQPVNPLGYSGLLPSDRANPRIAALAINPLGMYSTVDEAWETKTYQARWDKKRECYFIPEKIYVWGEFGIEVFAYALSRGYQLGIHTIQLFVNDQLVSHLQYDSFSYREYRQNYLVVNRKLFLEGKGKFQRLYRISGTSLPFYQLKEGNNGILSTLSPDSPSGLRPGINQLKLIVVDKTKKQRSLLFQLIARPPFSQKGKKLGKPVSNSPELKLGSLKVESEIKFFEDFLIIETTTDLVPPLPPQCYIHQAGKKVEKISLLPRTLNEYVGRYRILPYSDGRAQARIAFSSPTGGKRERIHSFTIQTVSPEKGGTVVSDDGFVRITFRPGGVNEIMFPRVDKLSIETPPSFLEPVGFAYQFKPLAVTFNLPGEIAFQYPESVSDPHQLAIFYQDKGVNWRYLSNQNEPKKKTFTARIPFFAKFALMRDAFPPNIHFLSPNSGACLQSGNTRLSARIIDKGSGINYHKTFMKIDGVKVPAEYVPKKGLLFFTPLKPLETGSHCMEIIASDLVGNSSKGEVKFKVQTN